MRAGTSDSGDIDTDVAVTPIARTYLVVLLAERAVQLLPSSGTIALGRAVDADVCIDHPSVSREHAVLDIDAMTVTDLRSRNGTFVGGQRLEPLEPLQLALGEAIQIGEVTILLHGERPISTPVVTPLRDFPLELRLVDEIARAARHGSTFTHARIHVAPAHTTIARDLITAALRSSDVLVEEAPGQLQLLLPAIVDDRSKQVVARLVALLERGGVPARAGIASYPQDGVTAPQLSAHARRQIEVGATAPSAFDEVANLIGGVAESEITVLITGDTGVGKELVAEMIHRMSSRAGKPFARINCAAISEQLLETELFGHARGAFTGADAMRTGLLESAQGGTVFLDEIGEMSLRLQATLLRVLEERVVRRVGESETRPIDVRIVCATNRLLLSEAEAGRFRQDLYYRLSGVTIEIPPLRDRRDMLEPLARAFAALASAKARRPQPAFSPDALAALHRHTWPGNIRELRNVIERAVLLAGAGVIAPNHLGLGRESRPTMQMAPVTEPIVARRDSVPNNLSSELADLERARIIETLEQCGGNQTRAARLLGISRTTLVARMEAYALRRPRK
jgi:DNA-binding NtrC family response regulator